MNHKLLTTKEAAEKLGVSAAYLERDRWAGARVPFVRLGKRSIRYRQEDLDNFITSSLHQSTSSYSTPQTVGA